MFLEAWGAPEADREELAPLGGEPGGHGLGAHDATGGKESEKQKEGKADRPPLSGRTPLVTGRVCRIPSGALAAILPRFAVVRSPVARYSGEAVPRKLRGVYDVSDDSRREEG